MAKSIHIKDPETVAAVNEIAQLLSTKEFTVQPHNVAERLFKKSAKSKLARMKRK